MDFVNEHPSHGIMNIDVLSFGRLSHRILEEVGEDNMPLLDDTGKSLILRRIARQLEQDLPALGSKLKKIGYIHEVKSVISEFMQYGISPDGVHELVEYAKGRGALKSKLTDLETLYRAFLSGMANKKECPVRPMTTLGPIQFVSSFFYGKVTFIIGKRCGKQIFLTFKSSVFSNFIFYSSFICTHNHSSGP